MRNKQRDKEMIAILRNHPESAPEFLDSFLQEANQPELLFALRQVAESLGGVQAIARKANLNPTQLYRTLSEDGNPALSSLTAILKPMGLRLSISPID
jgi:probable addiction module antidote protein